MERVIAKREDAGGGARPVDLLQGDDVRVQVAGVAGEGSVIRPRSGRPHRATARRPFSNAAGSDSRSRSGSTRRGRAAGQPGSRSRPPGWVERRWATCSLVRLRSTPRSRTGPRPPSGSGKSRSRGGCWQPSSARPPGCAAVPAGCNAAASAAAATSAATPETGARFAIRHKVPLLMIRWPATPDGECKTGSRRGDPTPWGEIENRTFAGCMKRGPAGTGIRPTSVKTPCGAPHRGAA